MKAPKKATVTAVWSKVIRERDDYTCQVCGLNLRHVGGADASHHIAKGMGAKLAVAWDLDNGSTKCRECHRWMDTHPLDHAEWIRNWLGEERYQALKVRANEPPAMTPMLKNEIHDYLKRTLKALEARRANGEIGRLEIHADERS